MSRSSKLKASESKLSNWQIFTGVSKVTPHRNLESLPPSPPWRPYDKLNKPKFETKYRAKARETRNDFVVNPEMIEAVNAALYLRRPLLLTGKPGIGKSSLIEQVAHELSLGSVLRWPVTSRSTLKEGLYQYDAIGRLQSKDDNSSDKNIGKYLQLGPLGTALLPTTWPMALLIDEIDKSDIDLPNDLLNIFEEGEYFIPELSRAAEVKIDVRTWKDSDLATIVAGHVQCKQFPFVVLTSNGEREFPPAFLRRCIRLSIAQPDDNTLKEIIKSYFADLAEERTKEIVKVFLEKRQKSDLATDQLLNAVFLLKNHLAIDSNEFTRLRELILKQLDDTESP